LARTLKLGAGLTSGSSTNQRFANDGTLLTNPAGSGVPAQHRGDYGIYGVIDQQIYRPRGGAADSGISVFVLLRLRPPTAI